MIKKLRRRLTFILTGITGVILVLIMAIILYFTVSQIEINSSLYFTSIIDSFALDIAQGKIKLEDIALPDNIDVGVAGNYIISVKAGDKTIAATGSLPENMQNEIISLAENSAAHYEDNVLYDKESLFFGMDNHFAVGYSISAPNVVDTENTSIVFTSDFSTTLPVIEYDGRQYRVNPSSIAVDNQEYGEYIDLMVIEDLADYDRSIIYTCIGFGALALAGIAALFAVNWFLTKLIVKPTADAVRQQTEFVAAASHELRSPITVLSASLSAAEIAATEDEADKYRSCAVSESKRLERLVNDLLQLAGSDSNKWSLHRTNFDLDTLLIEIHEKYQPIAKSKAYEFSLELPERALGSFNGDKDRIQQILGILIDNALEYSPENTAVTVAAHRKKGRLYISVKDQGDGIPDSVKRKIFRRFYRADESRSDKAHFGLGLPIARELAELHGGKLTVEDPPGKGSEFILRL